MADPFRRDDEEQKNPFEGLLSLGGRAPRRPQAEPTTGAPNVVQPNPFSGLLSLGGGGPLGATGQEALSFKGFQAEPEIPESRPKPLGERVLSVVFNAIDNVLRVAEPLLLPGDVAKAFIYGYAKGGTQLGLYLAREQIGRAASYAPFGSRPDQVVSGSELARTLVGEERFQSMSPWARMGLSFAVDIAADPLSVFGVVGAAAKGTALAARGASALAKAGGLERVSEAAGAVGRGLEAVAQTAFRADELAQRTLNPFAQATEAARLIGRVPIGEERTVGAVFQDAVSKILEITPIKRVHSVRGLQHDVGIRLVDFVDPIGATPREHREYISKMPGYFHIPLRAKATYSDIENAAVKVWLPKLNEIINGVIKDGEQFTPVANEIAAQAFTIVDRYGVAEAGKALKEAEQTVRQVARAVGYSEDKAAQLLHQLHDTTRQAVLDLTYRINGFEDYKRTYMETAAAMGLDPEEAWNRYAGLKAGYDVLEGGVVREAPKPTIETIRVPKAAITNDFIEARRIVSEATNPRPLLLRAFSALPWWEQQKVIDNIGEELISQYMDAVVKAQNRRAINDFSKNLPRLIQGAFSRREAPGLGGEAKKLANALKRTGPISLFKRISEVVDNATTDDILDLITSSNDNRSALGYMMLGYKLEEMGDYTNALIAYGRAAGLTSNDTLARYLSISGAPVIVPVQDTNAILRPRFGAQLVEELKEADKLTPSVIDSIHKAITSAPGTILNDIVREVSEAKPSLAPLVQAIVNRDLDGIGTLIAQAVRTGQIGDLQVSNGAIETLLGVAKAIGGEEGAARVAKAAGLSDFEDLPKFRATIRENLLRVEAQALKKFWRDRPNWYGATTLEELLAIPDDPISHPNSPLIVFENLRRGYIRYVYGANISRDAAISAVMKGRVQLIPEFSEETIVNNFTAWARESGIPNAEAAARELASYLSATRGRYVYSSETLLALLKKHGVALDEEQFNQMMNRVFGSEAERRSAIRAILGGEAGTSMHVPPARLRAQVFQSRKEGAEALLRLYDPVAAVGELARVGAREAMANTIQQETYNLLRQAGLVLDANQIGPEHARDWVKVPEHTVVLEDGRKVLAYGPLSGKFVPKVVFNDLVRSLSASPVESSAWQSFLTFWRKALLNNPKTAIVNALGNFWLTWANMGPQFATEAVAQLPRAMRILEHYERYGTLPEGIPRGVIHFLRESSLNREVRRYAGQTMLRILRENPEVYTKGVVQRFIERVDDYANEFGQRIAEFLGRENDPYIKLISPLELFAYFENVVRISNFLAAMKLGRGVEEAARIAADATFNYTRIPYGLQLIREYGLMAFPSFSYFIASSMPKWLRERPAVFTAPQRFAQASWEAGTDSPEESARALVYLQDYVRNQLPAILPMKRKDGSYVAVPLTYVLPIKPFDSGTMQEIVGLGVFQPFLDATNGLIQYVENQASGAKPVLGAQWGGQLYEPFSTPGQAAIGTVRYLLSKFAPSYATRTLPILEAPELIPFLLAPEENKEAISRISSAVGRLAVQYRNPDIVNAIEEITGRAIGYTAGEALIALTLAAPKRAPTNPERPPHINKIRGLELRASEAEQALRDMAKRGFSEESIAAKGQRAVESIRKALEPYLLLEETYGGLR